MLNVKMYNKELKLWKLFDRSRYFSISSINGFQFFLCRTSGTWSSAQMNQIGAVEYNGCECIRASATRVRCIGEIWNAFNDLDSNNEHSARCHSPNACVGLARTRHEPITIAFNKMISIFQRSNYLIISLYCLLTRHSIQFNKSRIKLKLALASLQLHSPSFAKRINEIHFHIVCVRLWTCAAME